MGTGKSTVGRLTAELAGVPFCELDERVEARAGSSVAGIFREQGEAAFRALERGALEEALARGGPAVIALGGGALLDRSLRTRALDEAWVVVLEASEAAILERTRGDERPLLSGDTAARRVAIRRLVEQRGVAYSEAHRHIPTVGVAPAKIAETLVAEWRGGRRT